MNSNLVLDVLNAELFYTDKHKQLCHCCFAVSEYKRLQGRYPSQPHTRTHFTYPNTNLTVILCSEYTQAVSI